MPLISTTKISDFILLSRVYRTLYLDNKTASTADALLTGGENRMVLYIRNQWHLVKLHATYQKNIEGSQVFP